MRFYSVGLWVDHLLINPDGEIFAVSALSDCDFRSREGVRYASPYAYLVVPFGVRPVHLRAYAAMRARERRLLKNGLFINAHWIE